MGDQIIAVECYFYDGGYCEFYDNDCKEQPQCKGGITWEDIWMYLVLKKEKEEKKKNTLDKYLEA